VIIVKIFFSKILLCKFQESEENIDSNYNWYARGK